MNKCLTCENYLAGLRQCKFCVYKEKEIDGFEKGVIKNATVGFSKYDDMKEHYLSIEVQIDDGWLATLKFNKIWIDIILDRLISDEEYYKNVNMLVGREVYLKPNPQGGTLAPIAIAEALNTAWIYKEGFN